MAADADEIVAAPVFRALADPTRRQILQALRKGELAAGDIASRFPISGPSVSRHLAVLKAAGLVTERREANRVMYSLVAERLALCVGSFLSAVCPEELVARHQGKKKPKGPEKATAKLGERPSGKDKHRRGHDKAALAKPAPDRPAPDKGALDKGAPDKPAPDKAASDEAAKPVAASSDATADQLNATV